MSGPRRGRIRGQVPTSGTSRRKPGEVTLKVPKLRNLPFETAIIELLSRGSANFRVASQIAAEVEGMKKGREKKAKQQQKP
jgi:hypothetical protein